MSNYLFVAGKPSFVQDIQQHFQIEYGADEQEISSECISNDHSILIIERRNSSEKSSIIFPTNSEGLFFRGQCLDHGTSSMVFGNIGFSDYQSKFNKYLDPTVIADFEGTFVLARWNENVLTIQNDLFSIYRLLCYFDEDIVIASDSLCLIVECMKSIEKSCKLNLEVATSKAWPFIGLPNAPLGNELIVKGVYTLQPGAHLEVRKNGKKLEPRIVQTPIRQQFTISDLSYKSAIRLCAKQMYSSINFLVESLDPVITFGLSGGIDSRVLLALCLRSSEIMERVAINTSENPARAADYEVVQQLSDKFGFDFNNQDRKNGLLKARKVKRHKINNQLGFWKLSCMGVYDAFYLTPFFYEYPKIISMLGVGAEAVKQTLDKTKLENLAKYQHPSIVAAVHQQVSKSLISLGVDPYSSDAMKWHHMTHKAAYHIGFKTSQSSMLLRPFVQRSVFTISLLPDNPFRGTENSGPTVLHDVLILLNKELACQPYDSIVKNISAHYADLRLKELGGPISIEELSEPQIFGDVRNIANGPAKSFQNMVADFSWNCDESQREQLLNMVEENYQNKIPLELKEIYEKCYLKAKDQLSNPKVELASSGSLAARFLVFDLFDE